MIAEKLTEPVFWVLAGSAILNIMQRRHHKHCVKKRTATLYWAIMIFAFYIVVVVVASNEAVSDYFLIAGAAIVIAAGYFLREKAFPHRIKCESCGERLNFERILYYDSNMCEKCDPPNEDDQPKQQGFLSKFMKQPEPPAPAPENEPVVVPDTVEEVDWDNWKFSEQAVICYIKNNDSNEILLINKKTGLGEGKVNAPGGRIEAGEMPVEAVIRECQEEVGLTPAEPKLVGDLFFIFKNGYSLRGFVYTAEAWEGELIETDEAEPFWCSRERIPYDKMWADDALWLEKALDGTKITGRFIFDDDEMLSDEVEFEE